ncbi:MAG: response regulator transcription factor [Sphingomonas sp.]|uniref:winged helix-turn-helix domain-containing protein n=1 Tax=Sphingomonas sp. TaxID=28214 RepID=UPI001B12D948|nr:response regulator transcription factor [Sphingomonas sp.]MBO9622069.1 response regulator transcription factor [Sphingomonas sp.]
MTAIVACALHIPQLRQAATPRGFTLLPVPRARLAESGAQLAVVGAEAENPARCVTELRGQGWLGPLLLVLAPGSRAGVAQALDAGADDAVAMPASAAEIAARIAARLRHRPAPIRLGGLSIDSVERRVAHQGKPLRLLPREYALLHHLARRSPDCASRTELLEAVWGLRFDPGTNVVEVHVSRLRAQLAHAGAAAMLRTEKGRGYRLAP